MKKILIVDDEPNARLLINRALGKNYAIIEASDGEEAIGIASQQKPDLILMDIMMPKVDGFNACYALKQNKETAKIPVVMLTAIDFELDRKLGEKMGADGYLTKPLNSRVLINMINKFLN